MVLKCTQQDAWLGKVLDASGTLVMESVGELQGLEETALYLYNQTASTNLSGGVVFKGVCSHRR